MGAVPSRNNRGRPLEQIPGMMPSPLDLPEGCAFRTRCPRGDARCAAAPPLEAVGEGRRLSCFHPHARVPA
jgi:peptide/nickel transport system ATP-binding protein